MTFSTLADVRSQIDSIDSELVSLIAQRAECVKAAAAFKTDHSAVRAPRACSRLLIGFAKRRLPQGYPK